MILYDGPSLIDGEPIVVIAVEDSNPKTGKMLFTWILRQDKKPSVSAFNGGEFSICGDCKFRAQPSIGASADYKSGLYDPKSRTCYVRLTGDTADEKMSPDHVWSAWKNGNIPYYDSNWGFYDYFYESSLLQYYGDLPIRIGSYGDPAAVRTLVWEALVSKSKRWTGYTHRWKNCDQRLKKYCMASVDTKQEREDAKAMGWRTFLVVPENRKEVMPNATRRHHSPATSLDITTLGGDILCPATAGKSVCAKCSLCMGTSSKASKSIWEVAHGKNKENHKW